MVYLPPYSFQVPALAFFWSVHYIPLKNNNAKFVDDMTLSVNYLVICNKGNKAWAHVSYGRKFEQAKKWQAQGNGIKIITEANTEALIGKNGHVSQIRLKDGTLLDADLVVFAVGIRPNITLAQSAGLRCNRGILVNDTMQTFDPSIYAVGECIEHRNQTFGLVEPLWGQAFICATHLAEHGSLTFKSPTVPTQLKVSGVDVFSAGNFEPKEDYEDIILNDEKRHIYKRIIIQKDKVIGAVLFGDTEDGMWYAELIADQTPVSTFRNKLLFGKDFALKKAG